MSYRGKPAVSEPMTGMELGMDLGMLVRIWNGSWNEIIWYRAHVLGKNASVQNSTARDDRCS